MGRFVSIISEIGGILSVYPMVLVADNENLGKSIFNQFVCIPTRIVEKSQSQWFVVNVFSGFFEKRYWPSIL